jgi:GNAT superfamily N-acetyltransferase
VSAGGGQHEIGSLKNVAGSATTGEKLRKRRRVGCAKGGRLCSNGDQPERLATAAFDPKFFGVSDPAKLTPPAPLIRPATDADVLPMARVHIMSWRETYPGLLPDPMLARLSIADQAIRWQRMLDRPDGWGGSLAFVADQEGSVVGYGTCSGQRTRLLQDRGFTGEVGELYLLRRAQGRGAGSALMRAMAAALAQRGHRAMSLWVLERNGHARRFYERLGGSLIAGKQARFAEVAYGWNDLRTLIDRGDDSSHSIR